MPNKTYLFHYENTKMVYPFVAAWRNHKKNRNLLTHLTLTQRFFRTSLAVNLEILWTDCFKKKRKNFYHNPLFSFNVQFFFIVYKNMFIFPFKSYCSHLFTLLFNDYFSYCFFIHTLFNKTEIYFIDKEEMTQKSVENY